MPIELHLSNDFRKHMSSKIQGLIDNDLVGLVYNEMLPHRSFFVIPRNQYIKTTNSTEASDLLAGLDEKLRNKFREMSRKKDAKNVQ